MSERAKLFAAARHEMILGTIGLVGSGDHISFWHGLSKVLTPFTRDEVLMIAAVTMESLEQAIMRMEAETDEQVLKTKRYRRTIRNARRAQRYLERIVDGNNDEEDD